VLEESATADGSSAYYLGVDIGGTFTDLAFHDAEGVLHCIKVPSTPRSPGRSTLAGIDELRASLPVDIDTWRAMHHTYSSTVATNAVIERRGATCGLITTQGFRDLLELQRLAIPNPMQFTSRRPRPLIPRALVREVVERISVEGEELTPLDLAQLRRVTRELVAAGVEIVVVCFLHSYRYPAHENEARRLLEREFPDLRVELSSRVWPQAREYERATLTTLNAFIRPVVEDYLAEIVGGTQRRGVEASLRVARSNGGMELGATIRERPAVTLLSGPAAGVAGAAAAALDAGWAAADLMTLDVGGTSADIGVIRNGRSVLSTEEHVADFPLLIPTVAVSSIGAGGGSVIWLDNAATLRVGPRSVGADPGPASYRADGTGTPALTDAFLLTGILRGGQRLAGRLPLHVEPARRALQALGDRIELDAVDVADGAVQIAVAITAAEATAVLARRGVDLPEFRMVAYGGAGPMLAALVAEEVYIDQVLIPPTPGALSALGAAQADLEGDLVRPVYGMLDQVGSDVLGAEVAQLQEGVREWLAEQIGELSLLSTTIDLAVDMRYDGQGYDVTVPLDPGSIEPGLEKVAERFHAAHRETFGHADQGAAVWIKELRAHVTGTVTKPSPPSAAGPTRRGNGGQRRIRLRGQDLVATTHWRSDLTPGDLVPGPSIIDQMDTTTVVPPGWDARVLPSNSIVLLRRS
jgi:N-methylhydantoinase A